MQNNLEEREPDMHARKNVIAIIKKIASKLFVVVLLASVFIGILTVIPEEVKALTTPSRPLALKATASDRVVNLNWHAPVDDGSSAITEYTIYRGTSSDAGSYLDSVSEPTTSYTDTTVTNDQIYYYKVSAENSVGEGAKSNEASATPTSSVTTPTPPQTSTGTSPLDSNWMITLIVAIIGAVGVIAAALINYLSSKNKK